MALFFNSSCDKEITKTAYSIDTTKTATIIIEAYANIDNSDVGNEAAPNGTKFITSVAKSDFVSGNSTYITATHTITADGKITITVPVDDNGVTYTVTPQDFVYDQVQIQTNYQNTIPKLFKSSAQSVYIRTGEVKALQFFFSENTQYDFNELINLSGFFTGNFNDTTGTDTLKAAKSFIFYGSGWSTEVMSATDGSFSVDVPKNMNIYYNCDFVQNKWVLVDTVYQYKPYRYKVTGAGVPSSYSSVSVEDISVTVGSGTAVK